MESWQRDGMHVRSKNLLPTMCHLSLPKDEEEGGPKLHIYLGARKRMAEIRSQANVDLGRR